MKPKDRDFIKTLDDHFFCILGYLHPPDRYTAYLKYVPSRDGKWGSGDARYTRTLPFYHVSQVENTYQYLKSTHPEYIYHCPVRHITISAVPVSQVKTYFKPRERLMEMRKRGAVDQLEKKTLELSEILICDMGEDSLGITGSILINIHNPDFSDIDLTVYGLEASLKLKEALVERKKNSDKVKAPSRLEIKRWITERARKFPLNSSELRRASLKRWNYGYYKGTYFSVHPTRTDGEIKENYGDNTYHRLGEAKGTAQVSDTSESIFLPAVYGLKDVTAQNGDDVTEIVSFEGMYGGLFEEGERIEFKGILEKVEGKNPHQRVIVGGSEYPNGFIKWV